MTNQDYIFIGLYLIIFLLLTAICGYFLLGLFTDFKTINTIIKEISKIKLSPRKRQQVKHVLIITFILIARQRNYEIKPTYAAYLLKKAHYLSLYRLFSLGIAIAMVYLDNKITPKQHVISTTALKQAFANEYDFMLLKASN